MFLLGLEAAAQSLWEGQRWEDGKKVRQAASASKDPGAASVRFPDLMGILEFHSG